MSSTTFPSAGLLGALGLAPAMPSFEADDAVGAYLDPASTALHTIVLP